MNATIVASKETYLQYEDLLFNRARSVSLDYGVDMNELVSYSRTLFMEAVESYDPAKGASMCTHLYHKLKKLHHLGRKMFNNKKLLSLTIPAGDTGLLYEDVIADGDSNAEDRILFEYLETYAEADEYALAVAILDGTLNPSKGNKARMTAWAVYQRGMRAVGWDWPRTQKAWDGLTSVMTSYRLGNDHTLR